jgi:hypothetical protein
MLYKFSSDPRAGLLAYQPFFNLTRSILVGSGHFAGPPIGLILMLIVSAM